MDIFWSNIAMFCAQPSTLATLKQDRKGTPCGSGNYCVPVVLLTSHMLLALILCTMPMPIKSGHEKYQPVLVCRLYQTKKQKPSQSHEQEVGSSSVC